MAERHLPKVDVASSSLVSRFSATIVTNTMAGQKVFMAGLRHGARTS
jgi:hypothetical protein